MKFGDLTPKGQAGMEDSAPNINDAQDAVAEVVAVELGLGLNLLDVAATTADREHAQRSIKNAVTALRTADRFLWKVQPDTLYVEELEKHRALLAQRLREVTGSGRV